MADATDTLQPPAEKAETRKEADEKPTSSKFYLTEVAAAGKRDKDWVERARKVVDRYRDERGNAEGGSEKRANIFWSNTELLKAALFQGIGNPDVRRRFPKKGKDEKNTKQAALVMERSATYINDAYDCDSQIEAAVEDMVIPGRGVCWVVYDAIISKNAETSEEEIGRQTVRDEHVYWEDFRTSAGRKWSDVWWVGRRHQYSRDELTEYFPDHADEIPLTASLKPSDEDKKDDDDTFKRANVWQIWDKTKRQRVYVAEGYKWVLKAEEDPYRLEAFFPVPEPLYGVKTTSSLEPVPEFCLYQDQANELDVIATRLCVLIDALRRRGAYDAGTDGHDSQLGQLAFAKDNEFVPVRNWSSLMEKGGLKNVFQTEDLTPIVTAIEGLYKRAAFLIQQIYDVTGISDVMRGSNAQDQTATEVRLKGQYGGLRIQARQKKVHRFIRELVRLKTELIAEHFTKDQLEEMTGIEMPLQSDKQQAMQQLEAFQAQEQQRQQLQQQQQAQQPQGGAPPGMQPQGGAQPPMLGHNGGPPMAMPQLPPPPSPEVIQQLQEITKLPSWEDVSAILRSDQRRGYKIDVETDQTAQIDEQVEKQSRIEFMNQMGMMMEKSIPLAMQLPMMRPLVKESVLFTVKAFKAGRTLEEAFDEAFSQLEKMPPPPQGGGDPVAQAKAEQIQTETKLSVQQHQQDTQQAQYEAGITQMQNQADMQLKNADLQAKQQDITINAANATADRRMKMQEAQFNLGRKIEENEFNKSITEANARLDIGQRVQQMRTQADADMADLTRSDEAHRMDLAARRQKMQHAERQANRPQPSGAR